MIIFEWNPQLVVGSQRLLLYSENQIWTPSSFFNQLGTYKQIYIGLCFNSIDNPLMHIVQYVSGTASQLLLVGHNCVTGGTQAIKLGHTYINEVGHTQFQVGHRPNLAPPWRRLWSQGRYTWCGRYSEPRTTFESGPASPHHSCN